MRRALRSFPQPCVSVVLSTIPDYAVSSQARPAKVDKYDGFGHVVDSRCIIRRYPPLSTCDGAHHAGGSPR